MKVKIKITVEQFQNLVNWIQRSTYNGLNDLSILNIRLFVGIGLKKIIDLRSEQFYQPQKIKTFSIEINQYTAIMACLTNERNFLDPYTLSIYLTLQNQNKQLLTLIP